jgi:hypothetical protein
MIAEGTIPITNAPASSSLSDSEHSHNQTLQVDAGWLKKVRIQTGVIGRLLKDHLYYAADCGKLLDTINRMRVCSFFQFSQIFRLKGHVRMI